MMDDNTTANKVKISRLAFKLAAARILAKNFDCQYDLAFDSLQWYFDHNPPEWWYKQPFRFFLWLMPLFILKSLEKRFWKEIVNES